MGEADWADAKKQNEKLTNSTSARAVFEGTASAAPASGLSVPAASGRRGPGCASGSSESLGAWTACRMYACYSRTIILFWNGQ